MLELRNEIMTFRTAFGWCALLGRERKLRGLSFARPTATAATDWLVEVFAEPTRRANWNKMLAARIAAALDGEPTDFRDVDIDVSHMGAFSRRVVAACRKITWGRTASYAELARLAGSAGAARAVGSVMASNRIPLIVPCHRIIASGGKIGGFSAPQGVGLKQKLLRLESPGIGFGKKQTLRAKKLG